MYWSDGRGATSRTPSTAVKRCVGCCSARTGRADEKGAAEAVGDDGERQLQAAVEAAIRQLDRQEGQDVDEEAAATWIPAAYGFTRHDPYDYGAIDYIIDSGQVLKKLSWPERSDGVERCREVVRGVLDRRSGISTLADVVGDSDVVNLAAVLEETAPGLFPAGFRSLVIFCRWKELFHGWREAVDLQALGNEARELVAAGIDFRSVRESLWLLGCFAGHERVAPMRYAAEGQSWWCGEKLSLVKIRGSATGTAREGEVSGDAGEPAATTAKPGTVRSGEAPGESGEQAVAAGEHAATAAKLGTARAGGVRREVGERAAATGRPEAIRDGAVSGEARQPTAAAGKPEMVRDGAMSGEGGERAAAAEPETVPGGRVRGRRGTGSRGAEAGGSRGWRDVLRIRGAGRRGRGASSRGGAGDGPGGRLVRGRGGAGSRGREAGEGRRWRVARGSWGTGSCGGETGGGTGVVAARAGGVTGIARRRDRAPHQPSKTARRIVTDSDAFSSARTNCPPPAWATRCMKAAVSG